MLPTIGFIVAATGLVICLYVIARSIALAQKPETKLVVTILALITTIAGVVALVWIVSLSLDLNREARRASDETLFAPR